MNENSDSIRALIIELCEKEGSQTRFARRIGSTPQKVNNWVAGRNGPDNWALSSISQAYGIPMEAIVGGSRVEHSSITLPSPADDDLSEVGACMRKMTETQRRAIVTVAKAMVE